VLSVKASKKNISSFDRTPKHLLRALHAVEGVGAGVSRRLHHRSGVQIWQFMILSLL